MPARSGKVLDLFEEEHIIEHVREVAPYLEEKLDELVRDYAFIETRRGAGLMAGSGDSTDLWLW